MIPYSRQAIDEEDIQAVVDVLRSDFLTQGSVVSSFENELCRYTGARHAIASTSGTTALHLAMLALEVGSEDIVWTTTISFVATANAALYCGASIDFVDIEISSFNISLAELEQKLEEAEKSRALPKVLIIVHMGGNPVALQEISILSKKYKFVVVEDACHALGASYQGNKIGMCQYSDITVFSFHPVKSITCGEGGALLTNSDFIAKKSRLMANNGITKDPSLFENNAHGDWYYEQQALGYNYRMSDIHAALGLSQMLKLDSFIAKRKQWAQWYQFQCKALPITFQEVENGSESAWHLLIILVDESVSWSCLDLYNYMLDHGVKVQKHYIPIYKHPIYSEFTIQKDEFGVAEDYYERSISIPVFPSLKLEQAVTVVNCLKGYFE